MNFRDFLQNPAETVVLPYLAGRRVVSKTRGFRLREDIGPGWYEFRIEGRYLVPIRETESALEAHELPRVVGYLAGDRIVGANGSGVVHLLPREEEFARFTPIAAYRWHDGNLLFSEVEFESEVEGAVREAYELEKDLSNIRGLNPWLVQAFVLDSTARALLREAEARAERTKRLGAERAEIERRQETLEGRLSLALSHAGAVLLDWRKVAASELAIRYEVAGVRLECIVDSNTLQILDAGICLDGADSELNLASLPAAVREAIESGMLNVHRYG